MRMDPSSGGPTAADLVNRLPEAELRDILFRYGEEPRARQVVREIVRARERAPIETTTGLADVVRRAGGKRGGIDAATRTFQALGSPSTTSCPGSSRRSVRGHENRSRRARGGDLLPFPRRPDRQDPLPDTLPRVRLSPELPVCRCGGVSEFSLVTRRAARPTEAETRSNPRARKRPPARHRARRTERNGMMNARVGTDALIDSRPSGLRTGGGRAFALKALLAAGLIVAALTLYIWQRFQVIELGYKVDRFKTERETLVRMNNNLRIESASLKSLDRVERIAARQIGLKPVERERFVLVKVVPGAGAPEQEPGRRPWRSRRPESGEGPELDRWETIGPCRSRRIPGAPGAANPCRDDGPCATLRPGGVPPLLGDGAQRPGAGQEGGAAASEGGPSRAAARIYPGSRGPGIGRERRS